MKRIALLIVHLCICQSSIGFAQSRIAEAENSPAVIARRYHATYGVRTDAILAVLAVYERNGLSTSERAAQTERLIRDYSMQVHKTKGLAALDSTDISLLGIQNTPSLVNALNWDLFAKRHYLSTSGNNSPAVLASGAVKIWYGIPEAAVRAIASRLEETDVQIREFEEKLRESVLKYDLLLAEARQSSKDDAVLKRVETLLYEGMLNEAEKLLDSDYPDAKRKFAFKAHLYGRTKELLLKFEDAAEGYRDAMEMDTSNFSYLQDFAINEGTIGHYDASLRALEHGLEKLNLASGRWRDSVEMEFQENLGIICMRKGYSEEALQAFSSARKIGGSVLTESDPRLATQLRLICDAYSLLGEYDSAIDLAKNLLSIDSIQQKQNDLETALVLNSIAMSYYGKRDFYSALRYVQASYVRFGDDTLNPLFPVCLNNFGLILCEIDQYVESNYYYQQSVRIASEIFGVEHPDLAVTYGNLGQLNILLEEYDQAQKYLEKSMKINLVHFGENHHVIAVNLNNLAMLYLKKGDPESSLQFLYRAFKIDSLSFGIYHPRTSQDISNIGYTLHQYGKLEEAISYLSKSNSIDSVLFGEHSIQCGSNSFVLARCFADSRKFELAIQHCQKALSIMRFTEGMPESQLLLVRTQIAKLKAAWARELSKTNDFEKSSQLAEEAVEEAAALGDGPTAIQAMITIGINEKSAQQYQEAFQTFEETRQHAQNFAKAFQQSEESLPDSIKTAPSYIAARDSMLMLPFLKEIRFHKIACLEALSCRKEARSLQRQVIREAKAEDNALILELLRQEGRLKSKKQS
jgi:tetratricopeptide (TPR) repeat protein